MSKKMSKHSITSMRRRKQMMYLYTVFLLVLSLSIVLMPVASAIKENTRMLMYISGTAFWGGILGTICMALRINHCRKKNYKLKEKLPKWKQLGLIQFFQNKPAIMADISMFVSIVGFIFARIYIDELIISFIFLSVCVFSFGMHCMLNGVNYKFIKYDVRRDKKS